MTGFIVLMSIVVCFSAILALALNFQWGLGGMVNFGITGFYALGAYAWTSLGARGSVVSVNPANGNASKLATGLLGATSVALGPNGKIFVSELFGGKISLIDKGKVSTYVTIDSPLGLTFFRGALYAGTAAPTDENGNPTGTGTIVRIK